MFPQSFKPENLLNSLFITPFIRKFSQLYVQNIPQIYCLPYPLSYYCLVQATSISCLVYCNSLLTGLPASPLVPIQSILSIASITCSSV